MFVSCLCHSGPGLIGNTNPTRQYGCPDGATTAIAGGHFVCFDASLGRLCRRQAYRYLLQAQSHLELRVVPEPKAVFTVSLPKR